MNSEHNQKPNKKRIINSESEEERKKRIKKMEDLGFVDRTKELEGKVTFHIIYKR